MACQGLKSQLAHVKFIGQRGPCPRYGGLDDNFALTPCLGRLSGNGMQSVDVVIVGAGMAGASAAYHLAPHRQVVVLERETQPGYHSTGRSAALYSQTYGNQTVRNLTRASWDFFNKPPPGFSATPLLSPRGALFVGAWDDEPALRQMLCEMQSQVASVCWLDPDEVMRMVPVLRRGSVCGGVFEPDAMDMDVHAIHQGFLRSARLLGAQLFCDAQCLSLQASGSGWRVRTAQQEYQTKVVINAAGAWCDALAQLAGVAPIGLVPKRRTAFLADPPPGVDCAKWPLVIDAQERFYFKPDAGCLLMSPANEDPVVAQDVQPEELDVAIAVERIEAVTDLQVRRIRRKWAGLRSFVADKTPVVGFDPEAPGFFWLAGRGGYGTQTAPAMGLLASTLVTGGVLPNHLASCGVRAQDLAVGRVALASARLAIDSSRLLP